MLNNKTNKKICIITCFDTYFTRVKYLKKYFRQKGYITDCFCSSFSHSKKEYMRNEKDTNYIETTPYKKNISLSRILSHNKFSKNVIKKIDFTSYDLAWIMLPPNSLAKEITSKSANLVETKLIIDIIDLWPETFPTNNFIKNSFIFNYWKLKRDNYLCNADMIVTECVLFKDFLPKKYIDRTGTLYMCTNNLLQKNNDLQLSENHVSLCYLGSINNILDIDLVCSIIKKLKRNYKVHIHIIGNGEKRENFLNSLQNVADDVIFYGNIYDTKHKIDIFNQCHFGLNIMKDSVLVGLTMKSLDYFSAGLPIINNIKGDTWNIVNDYSAGYNIDKFSSFINYDYSMRNNAFSVYNDLLSESAFNKKLDRIMEILYE